MQSSRLAMLIGLVFMTTSVLASYHQHQQQQHLPIEFAPKFNEQKHYTYEWNAQLATGISGQQQNALQRMKAQLNLWFVSEQQVVAQLEKIELAHINDELPENVEPNTEIASMDLLKRDVVRDDQQRMLRLPFEIRYEQGKIVEIIFEQEDQTWSKNMKRSAINGLQMQLTSEDKTSSFKVNETTVEGECETIYTILPVSECQKVERQSSSEEQKKTSEQCVRVNSAINFEKCERTPELRYNFFRSQVLSEQQNQEAIEKSSVSEVELQHRNGKYMPVQTRRVSRYSVPVSRSNQLQMAAVFIGELRLISTHALITPPELQNKKDAESLEFNTEFDRKFERFAELGQPALFDETHGYMQEFNIPEVVINVIQRLAQTFVADAENHYQLDSEAAHQFENLVKTLRLCSEEELKTIHSSVCEGKSLQKLSEEQRRFVRELFHDALAVAGTQTTAYHLVQKIQDKQITEEKAASTLYKLAKNVPFVSERLLETVWKLCEQTPKNSKLQRTCVLSYSRLANVKCGVNSIPQADQWALQAEKKTEVCAIETRQQITENLKQLLETKDEEQKVLALKACGNAAIETLLPTIQRIIEDPQTERLTRVIAIDALRQFVQQRPIEIQSILMPVLMNRREFPEVRMNALQQLLKTRPQKTIIDQIAVEMSRESNMNMRAYAVTAFQGVAKQMKTVDMEFVEQLETAYKLIQGTLSVEEKEQLVQSSARFMAWNMPSETGVFSSAALFSNDSHLPKELMVQFDSIVQQHFLPAFAQLGIHQQNVEQLMGKLFAKLEDKTLDEIFVRGKRSTVAQIYQAPVKYLKNMFEQLQIVSRRSMNVRPQLMFYRREQNMDVAYGYLDEKHLPQLVKDLFMNGQIDLSALETVGERSAHWIDADFQVEQRVKIATAFGIPLVYTIRGVHVSNIRMQAKFELNGEANKIRSGNAKLHLVPKLSAHLVHKLEAFSPLFTAGVKTQHNLDGQLPIRVGAQYNSQNSEGLVLDLELPQSTKQINKVFQMTSHPSTIYRQWPVKSNIFVEAEERMMIIPQMEEAYRQIDLEHTCPMMGLRHELRGHYHQCESLDCWMIGENAIELHVHANEKSAKKLRMHIQLQKRNADEQLKTFERKAFQHLFEDKTVKQLFKNAQPNEIQILNEYAQRTQSFKPEQMYKLEFRVAGIDINNQPMASLKTELKAICTAEARSCTAEMEFSSTISPFTARLLSQFSRTQLSGVFGSMKSEHILAHTEAEWGMPEQKNHLTACVYGRPAEEMIHQWNRLMNLRTSERRAQHNQYSQMSDADYDAMVMQQMPTKLPISRLTFMVNQKINQSGLRRFFNYLMIARNPIQSLMTPMEQQHSHEQHLMTDIIYTPAGGLRVRYNNEEAHQKIKMPSMSMLNNEEYEQMTSLEYPENQEMYNTKTFGQERFVHQFGSNDARCFIDQDYNVRSFDGKKYRIPLTECYTVLAKDCSHEQPRFAVLAKRIDERSVQLKLVVPRTIYTLHQESGEMIIKANNVVLRKQDFEQYDIQVIRESRREIYVLRCSVTGMEVRFDGYNMEIRLTQDYVNKQCGVCGHFNHDITDTLRKQDNTPANTLKEFHGSFLYRNEEDCSIASIQAFEKREEETYRNQEEYDFEEDKENQNMGLSEKKLRQKGYKLVEPTPKTHVIELREKVCFSTMAYNKCPTGTFPLTKTVEDEEENQTVPFICYSRHNQKTRKMLKRIQTEGILSELKMVEPNKDETIRVPKHCATKHIQLY